MLGEPAAGALLARMTLCLRPKELCMLLGNQGSRLDVVEHSASFMYLDVELIDVETLAQR